MGRNRVTNHRGMQRGVITQTHCKYERIFQTSRRCNGSKKVRQCRLARLQLPFFG